MVSVIYLAITTISIVFLFLTILPIEAQCYGCDGQNSSELKQALLEKQMEELKQKNEQLDQNSQIITLLIGISIGLGSIAGIVTWILLKTRKILKK
jgi:hypothetical protein